MKTCYFWIPALLASFLLMAARAQDADSLHHEAPINLSWEIINQTTFTTKYIQSINANVLFPKFSQKLKKIDNKLVIVEGNITIHNDSFYVLGNYIYNDPVLGSFLESLSEHKIKIEIDFYDRKVIPCNNQYYRIQGILRLNDTDIHHMNFQITSAVILPAKAP